MTAVGGAAWYAQRQGRHHGAASGGIVGGFGSSYAFDGSLAELLWLLRPVPGLTMLQSLFVFIYDRGTTV